MRLLQLSTALIVAVGLVNAEKFTQKSTQALAQAKLVSSIKAAEPHYLGQKLTANNLAQLQREIAVAPRDAAGPATSVPSAQSCSEMTSDNGRGPEVVNLDGEKKIDL